MQSCNTLRCKLATGSWIPETSLWATQTAFFGSLKSVGFFGRFVSFEFFEFHFFTNLMVWPAGSQLRREADEARGDCLDDERTCNHSNRVFACATRYLVVAPVFAWWAISDAVKAKACLDAEIAGKAISAAWKMKKFALWNCEMRGRGLHADFEVWLESALQHSDSEVAQVAQEKEVVSELKKARWFWSRCMQMQPDAKKLQCVPQAIRAMKFLQLEDTHLRCVGLGLRPWQRSSIGLRRPVRSLVSLYARYSWYNLGKQISSKNFEVRNLNPWNKLASNSDSLLWQLEVCRAFWQICLIWVFWVSFFHQSHGMTCR